MAVDASVLCKLVDAVSVAGGGVVVVGSGGREVLAEGVDASVLARLEGTVGSGTVDVGAVDVAVATEEAGTTVFSCTALDDAPGC